MHALGGGRARVGAQRGGGLPCDEEYGQGSGGGDDLGADARVGEAGGATGQGPQGVRTGRKRRTRCQGGQLRLLTANVSSYGTLKKLSAELAAAGDLVAIQETKLVGPFANALAAAELAEGGWRALLAPAVEGPRGGASAGVAILHRRQVQCVDAGGVLVPGRLRWARFRTRQTGDFVVYSVYAVAGLGLVGLNLELLDELVRHSAEVGCPTIALGDFNCSPEQVSQALEERACPLLVAAPEDPTYVSGEASSVLDFAVVHRSLATVLRPLEVMPELALTPHRVVRTGMRLPGPEETVRVWKRGNPGSVERVVGPMPEVAPPEGLLTDLDGFRARHGGMAVSAGATEEVRAQLGGFFQRWAEAAQAELEPLCGMKAVPCQAFAFKEMPLRKLFDKAGRPDAPSARWCWEVQGMRAKEVRGIVRRRVTLGRCCRPSAQDERLAGLLRKEGGRRVEEALDPGHRRLWQGTRSVMLRLLEVPAPGGRELVLASAVVAMLEGLVAAAVAEERSARKRRWEDWVVGALEGGARAAFAFARRAGARGEAAAATAQAGDGWAVRPALPDPREVIQRDSAAWGAVWGAGEPGLEEGELPVGIELPAPLEPSDLVAASAAFSAGTSAVDGLHPRQVRWLSSGVLQALCGILRGFEAFGVLGGESREDLVVRLIPKAAGGHRPIALFRTVFRIWGKARADLLRQWADARLGAACWNCFGGRRPGDAVWRDVLKAEHASSQGKVVGSVMVDVSKMYDRVEHGLLIAAAGAADYPLWCLRCTLTAYRWTRTLVTEEGVVGPGLRPSRSVAPGSFAACFEVAALVAVAMEKFQARWPTVRVSVHVDDFTLVGTFPGAEAATTALAASALDLSAVLEQDLRLPIGRDKTVVTMSEAGAERALAAALVPLGARAEGAPRRLGVRMALRPSRDRRLQRDRLATLRRRAGRLRVLAKVKRAGRRPGRCYNAFLAGGLYGVEVAPLARGQLRQVRTQAAKLLRLFMPGAAPDLYWGLQRGESDPVVRHGWECLERYCREWFYIGASGPEVRPPDVLPPPVLVGAFAAARRRKEEAGRRNRRTAGAWPLDGVLEAIELAGWKAASANQLVDGHGQPIFLMDEAPAAVKVAFVRDAKAAMATRAAAARLGGAVEDGFQLDLLAAGRVLRATGKKRLAEPEKEALQALFAGGVRSADVLCGWGVLGSAACPVCGRPDSVAHRLYDSECGDEEVRSRRAELKLAGLHETGGGLKDAEGVRVPWFPRLPVPAGPWRGERVAGDLECGEMDAEGKVFHPEWGPIFVDGSCVAPLDVYASAAGAAVQVDAEGQVTACLTFVVPAGWPQTAAAGEHLAFYMADRFSVQGVEVVTDCAAVLRSADGGRRYAAGEKRPWAVLWKDMLGRVGSTTKVKAHQTREEAAAEGTDALFRWAGNDAADHRARARASRALPPEGIRRGIDAQLRAREAFYRGAAELLAGYPGDRDLVPEAKRGRLAHAGAALVLFHGHVLVWAPHRKRWVCTQCLHTATAARRRAFADAACNRRGAHLRAVMCRAEAQGHRVLVSFVEGPGTPVCMCTRCGCYAEAHAIGIGAPCKGRVQPGGTAYRLGRFLRGLHPTRGCRVQGPCQPNCLQAEGEPPRWIPPPGPALEAPAGQSGGVKRVAADFEHAATEQGDRPALGGGPAPARHGRACGALDDPDWDPFAWEPGPDEAEKEVSGWDEPPSCSAVFEPDAM